MTEEYRQNFRDKTNTPTSEGEMLLINQGVCYNCRKSGRQANKCKSQKMNKSKKFQGKYGTCGLKGHMSKDCWTKEENKSKRPQNRKIPSHEKVNTTVDHRSNWIIEYGWTMQDMESITFTNPDIWIADTGATVDFTSNPFFAKNWTKSPNETVVVMGNGQTEEVAKTRTLEGTAVKQNNERQGNVALSNVVYLPNGKYNLISITKVMENGWNLKEDLDGLNLWKKIKNSFW
jgi:hypothetical protein